MRRRWFGVLLVLFSSMSVLLSAAPAYLASSGGCANGWTDCVTMRVVLSQAVNPGVTVSVKRVSPVYAGSSATPIDDSFTLTRVAGSSNTYTSERAVYGTSALDSACTGTANAAAKNKATFVVTVSGGNLASTSTASHLVCSTNSSARNPTINYPVTVSTSANPASSGGISGNVMFDGKACESSQTPSYIRIDGKIFNLNGSGGFDTGLNLAPGDKTVEVSCVIGNNPNNFKVTQNAAKANISIEAGRVLSVGQLTNANAAAEGEDVEAIKCDAGPLFSWLVCGVIEFFVGQNGVVNNIRDYAIVPFLEAKSPTTDSPVYEIWSSFRNVAGAFFILVFFLVILGTALGFDNYTIKKIMPRLVAGAILVPFSWFLCIFILDIGNVLGKGIPTLMDPIIGDVTIDITQDWASFFGFGAGTVAAGFALSGAATPLGLAAVISLVIAIFGVFLTLIMRQILITLFIVLSPLALLAWILPNTEKWFKTWWQNLFKLTMMYPIIMLLFEAGRLFAKVVGATSGGSGAPDAAINGITPLVQIMALVMPLFLVPFAFKFAGSGLSMANGAIGKFTGGLDKKYGKDSDRAKIAAQNRARNNLARGKALEGAAGKADNVFKKAGLGLASRAAYRRAGFAKGLPGITNKTADLQREAAIGKAATELGTWESNQKNSAQAIPPESMKERIEAETIAAQQSKIADRGKRKGLVKDQSEMSPDDLARGNRAIYEAGVESTRRSQVQKRSEAEGVEQAAKENYQSSPKLSEYYKEHGYVHAAKERENIDGAIDLDNRLNKQTMEEHNAANPHNQISLHDAHQMRMDNIKKAANIAGGNSVIKEDIDATATVLASEHLTTAEIERSLASGGGPISHETAQNTRIKTAMAAGISQERGKKIAAEAGDQEYMDVENKAGGMQDAREMLMGERLLQRQKFVDSRTKGLGAIDADAKNPKTTQELLQTSRSKAGKDFAGTLGTVDAEQQAMNTEAKLDNLTPGTTAAYQAAANRTFAATASVRGRALSEAVGKEQGVLVADAKELKRAQKKALKAAKSGAGPSAAPTAETVRDNRLLNAAYDAQGASASQTTAAYAEIEGGANEYNKAVQQYQVKNPGVSKAAAQDAVTTRNLNNTHTTSRIAAENKYRKENENRQGIVDQYDQRIAAAATTIKAAKPHMTQGQAESAAANQIITNDLEAIGTEARQAGALSGRKVTDDAYGMVAGLESQIQEEIPQSVVEDQIDAAAKNAGAALPPAMVKQRAAAQIAAMTTAQKAALIPANSTEIIQSRNVAAASTSNITAAAERQRAEMSKAPGLITAHEAQLKQAVLEDRGNKASNQARAMGLNEQQTSKYVEAARNQAAADIASGTITREEQEQTALVAVAAAAQDKATRDAGSTDAMIAATNQAISDPTRLSAEAQLEVDTENAIAGLAAKRGDDEALWLDTRPGAKLNRSFATAKEAQIRVKKDRILDDRVTQAKQGKVEIYEYVKDTSRPGDFFIPKLDASGNKILKEKGTIRDINTSDDALASMLDEGVALLKDGQDDRGIALLDKVGTMAKGREMLRHVQYDLFKRDDDNPYNPNTSIFGDRTATLWNKIVANVPFEAAPDLHGPMIGVFKTADPAKLLKMDWRTQKTYFDYLTKRHNKHAAHVLDPVANPEGDKEGEKLYNAMSNTVASIFDEKNQNSVEKMNDDSVEQMAKFTFNLNPDGTIIPGSYTAAGARLAGGNAKQQAALDLLKERYETLHS